MVGRAGRVGQCVNGYGESFLLVQQDELPKAMSLMHASLPSVTSQINPLIDHGRGIMKAVLEMCSLGLCEKVSDIAVFIQNTLLYHSSVGKLGSLPSSSTLQGAQSLAFNDALSQEAVSWITQALNFLIQSNAIDLTLAPTNTTAATHPLASSSSLLPSNNNNNNNNNSSNSSSSNKPTPAQSPRASPTLAMLHVSSFLDDGASVLSISRFGRAMVKCSMNPDESIVIYRDLLRAQRGICLTQHLHILYLVSPLEHSFQPNFRQLLKWYESVKQRSGQSSQNNRVSAFIGDAIGLNESLLNKWSYQPPSYDDVVNCFEKMRRLSLQLWDAADARSGRTNIASLFATDPHASSTTAPTQPSQLPSSSVSKSQPVKPVSIDASYYECLCRCKRVWAALILDEVLSGRKPYSRVAAEFGCGVQDLESLRKSTIMVCPLSNSHLYIHVFILMLIYHTCRC